MEDVVQTKGQLLEQQSQEERLAFSAWKESYEQRVPPPKPPAQLELSNLGLQFWMYFGTAVASILLAAMRTSESFYRVGFATTGNQVYATIEALLSVLVIEVGLVVYAAALANKRYQKQEAVRKERAKRENARYRASKSIDANNVMMIVGLILMTLISMNAGLGQSIQIIETVDEIFLEKLSYSLSIAIGLGVSIIAFIGGEIVGQQIAIVTASYEERVQDYEDALEKYQQELEAAWLRSEERRIIRRDVKQAAKQGSISGTSWNIGGTSGTVGFGNGRRPAVQTERVFSYMDQIFQTEQRIPSFAEVQQVLALPKSTASRLRKEWLAERGFSEIPENGHGEGTDGG